MFKNRGSCNHKINFTRLVSVRLFLFTLIVLSGTNRLVRFSKGVHCCFRKQLFLLYTFLTCENCLFKFRVKDVSWAKSERGRRLNGSHCLLSAKCALWRRCYVPVTWFRVIYRLRKARTTSCTFLVWPGFGATMFIIGIWSGLSWKFTVYHGSCCPPRKH